MKKLVVLLGVIIVFMFTTVNADPYYGRGIMNPEPEEQAEPVPSPDVVTKGFDKKIAPQCPKTLVKQHESSISNCLSCHVEPTWEIIEYAPDIRMDYPCGKTKLVGNACNYQIIGEIGQAAMESLQEMFEYLEWHPEIDTVNIEILSGGGSLFLAWQMISVIESHKAKYEIVTKVPGFAASAAFLIFCAGETRLAYEHALLMHHELWTFSMFSLDDVSSSQEKARVMKFFQENIHDYLIARSILTKDQLHDYVEGEKDYWMTGSESLEVGFATGLIK